MDDPVVIYEAAKVGELHGTCNFSSDNDLKQLESRALKFYNSTRSAESKSIITCSPKNGPGKRQRTGAVLVLPPEEDAAKAEEETAAATQSLAALPEGPTKQLFSMLLGQNSRLRRAGQQYEQQIQELQFEVARLYSCNTGSEEIALAVEEKVMNLAVQIASGACMDQDMQAKDDKELTISKKLTTWAAQHYVVTGGASGLRDKLEALARGRNAAVHPIPKSELVAAATRFAAAGTLQPWLLKRQPLACQLVIDAASLLCSTPTKKGSKPN